MLITRKSGLTGNTNTRDIPVTEEELKQWEESGALIQNFFPHLSTDDREFLITGSTPEEWEMLGIEEEDEDYVSGSEEFKSLFDTEAQLEYLRQHPEMTTRPNGVDPEHWNQLQSQIAREKTIDALENGTNMMSIPMNQLPEPAIKYLKHLSRLVGLCGEVCLTAYTIYSQIALKMPCKDSLYLPDAEALAWWKANYPEYFD